MRSLVLRPTEISHEVGSVGAIAFCFIMGEGGGGRGVTMSRFYLFRFIQLRCIGHLPFDG